MWVPTFQLDELPTTMSTFWGALSVRHGPSLHHRGVEAGDGSEKNSCETDHYGGLLHVCGIKSGWLGKNHGL